ncbi:MAG: GNAT family N-acetyltransferase, partial [Euryarchaeota archaeon]|nr:GNAT family N-acetyltransferase [Euryarchaeota archaeon]
ALLESDLPILYEHQRDPEAIRMAAFTPEGFEDRAKFLARWAKMLLGPQVLARAIEVDGKLSGYVVHFEMFGDPAVAYWIAREAWGQGVATRALQGFLLEIPRRPLFARVAADNIASQRVLEKCGFVRYGRERAYANGRKAEIEELLYRRDAPCAPTAAPLAIRDGPLLSSRSPHADLLPSLPVPPGLPSTRQGCLHVVHRFCPGGPEAPPTKCAAVRPTDLLGRAHPDRPAHGGRTAPTDLPPRPHRPGVDVVDEHPPQRAVRPLSILVPDRP